MEKLFGLNTTITVIEKIEEFLPGILATSRTNMPTTVDSLGNTIPK